MDLRADSFAEFFGTNAFQLSEEGVLVVNADDGKALIKLKDTETTINIVRDADFLVLHTTLITDETLSSNEKRAHVLTSLMVLHELNLGVRTYFNGDTTIGLIADDFTTSEFSVGVFLKWIFQFQFVANIALSVISISSAEKRALLQDEIELLFEEPN